jgi:peptidoglycan/LPS O-acetylase OafA/YrhL
MRILRIDGVRGLAVSLVIVYHGLHFSLGWIGVDLFFVLSGYLITQILRRDRESPIYWRAFYIKRAMRILPPLALCLLLCAVFYPQEWHAMKFYYLFFLANVGLIPYHGAQEFGMLWSLAVEEHFYFFWPIAVRKLEPVLRALVTPYTTTYWPIYALTPFRLDGLAAGSLLALILERSEEHNADWITPWAKRAGLFSLIAIVALSLTHHFEHQGNALLFNTIGYSLTAIASASLVGFVLVNPDSRLNAFFENKAMVFMGTISYGLYLFHKFVFARFGIVADHFGWKHHAVLFPIALPCAIVGCWLSFILYEKRMVALGHKWVKQLMEKSTKARQPLTT